MSADLHAALASEHAKHVAGFNTTYRNGAVVWQDRGGIRCSCGWSAERESNQAARPWHLWHRHVVQALLAAHPATDADLIREAEQRGAAAVVEHRYVYQDQYEGTCACGESLSFYESAATVLGRHIKAARAAVRATEETPT